VPNAYPLSGRETVLDAIVQAGGLTRRAARDQIVLSRPTHPDGCRVVYPVCYDQIVQLGDTSTNYQLMPGDRVFVPSQNMLATLLPIGQRRCKSGPCSRPQVGCFGGASCATPAGGCAPAVSPAAAHPTVPAATACPTCPTNPAATACPTCPPIPAAPTCPTIPVITAAPSIPTTLPPGN
jgi:hypothetical protein